MTQERIKRLCIFSNLLIGNFIILILALIVIRDKGDWWLYLCWVVSISGVSILCLHLVFNWLKKKRINKFMLFILAILISVFIPWLSCAPFGFIWSIASSYNIIEAFANMFKTLIVGSITLVFFIYLPLLMGIMNFFFMSKFQKNED